MAARTRRRRVCSAKALRCRGLWFASGGELFTAEKFPKCAGGCGLRSPVGLCGVHPQEAALPRQLRSSGPSRLAAPTPSRLRAGQ